MMPLKAISGKPGHEIKQRLRTGTVVTTDDRNWELRFQQHQGDLV